MTHRSSGDIFLLLSTVLLVVAGCSGQAEPTELQPGTSDVLSPEEALESFSVPSGFDVELVAAEPLLSDPVAIDIDADGRIYVAEMRGWMNDIDGRGALEPTGIIAVLEDTTGDGQMDTRTVFLDSLILPRAVMAMSDGVLVGEPPYLWFAKDLDGDLIADEKEMVADDFGVRKANAESNANGLKWGIDNWVHTTDHERRYRKTDTGWAVDTTLNSGQFGLTMDNYGRMYRTANSLPILYDYVESRYYARNPNMPGNDGIEESPPEDLQVWPSRPTPGANRGYRENVLREDGTLRTFTAASGAGAYRGHTYPREYTENVNIFVPEPVANLVHRYVIHNEQDGRLAAVHGREGASFLRSTDERFRPVNMYAAPDGNMYVVDMYRGIIEHRDFQTTFLREHIEKMGLDEPIGLGRIYRIVHDDAPANVERPSLSSASADELVEHLSHPNGWWRDTAHRLLVERRETGVADAVRGLAESTDDVQVRLHALWVLEGLDVLDQETVVEALSDDSFHIRAAALRMAEPWLRNGSEEMIERVHALVDDPSPEVRLQAAASLGEAPTDAVAPALATLLTNYPEQPYLVETVLSGVRDAEPAFLERLLQSDAWQEEKEGYDDVLETFAEAIVKSEDADRIDRLFERAAAADTEPWQQLALLEGIEDRVPSGRGIRLPLELTREPAALAQLLEADDAAVREAARELEDRLVWPGKPGYEDRQAQMSPELQAQFERGREIYAVQCAACHGEDGRGRDGLGIGLVGSEYVNAAHYNLVRILLHGKEGEIALMPPQRNLSDAEIAEVLTYIRNDWGNQGYPVSESRVADVRAETVAREEPWTDFELEATVH